MTAYSIPQGSVSCVVSGIAHLLSGRRAGTFKSRMLSLRVSAQRI